MVAKPELSLLDGASAYAGKLRTRKGSTLELASILALAKHFDADLALPWHQLPEAFKRAFLYGTDEEIEVEIPGGGKHTDWSINRKAPLVGAIAELQRLFRDAKSEKARKNYRAFFQLAPCEECGGSGVSEAARTATINGWTYPHAADAVVDELRNWAASISIGLMESLVERGTTVLVADHQAATHREADWIITTGPGAGPAGGKIIDQAAPS